MYRSNPLKEKLAAGRQVYGAWVGMANPVAAEVLALAGYDFLILDNEHGPASLHDTLHLLQAISATPCVGVVRVPWNDPVYLKRVLDIGAEGVMIPSVDTAEQAERAVRACRYPPQGFRGSAYQVVRGAGYGIGTEDYPKTAAANLLVICQVESRTAVDNIAAIAAVDGVDMLFIGPNDLGGSIGRFGDLGHPELVGLIDRAEKSVKTSGKKLGGIPFGGQSAAELFRRGYDMLLSATDVSLMRDAALADLAGVKQRD